MGEESTRHEAAAKSRASAIVFNLILVVGLALFFLVPFIGIPLFVLIAVAYAIYWLITKK